MQALSEFVERLPPDIQQQVKDFAEFLLEKRRKRSKGKPTFDWAGALQDWRHRYTSVQLQHQIAAWRSDEA